MLATEPIFSMCFDEGQGRGSEAPVPYPSMACIPIEPELPKGLPTDGVERIPGCRALSLLYYGKYDAPGAFNEPRKLLWEEFERRGHVPAGPGAASASSRPMSECRSTCGTMYSALPSR